jgi:hypothetical protein
MKGSGNAATSWVEYNLGVVSGKVQRIVQLRHTTRLAKRPVTKAIQRKLCSEVLSSDESTSLTELQLVGKVEIGVDMGPENINIKRTHNSMHYNVI